DEGSLRQVRGIQYPVAESENNQGVPQVVYVQLDGNTLRNVRSLVSDQLINSKSFDRIPQFSSSYFTPSQGEQSPQDYKSFSSDSFPYVSKIDPSAEFNPSGNSLKDYAKTLIEPSSKPESDTKQSHMFGFYYMNIQKFPAPKVIADSDPGQKFNKNKEVEKLALDQGNENEIQKYLQQILQQQISKFVQLQNQEHSAYEQMNHQPLNAMEKEIAIPNWEDEYSSDQLEKDIKEKIAISEWSEENSFDQLGIKEKEYLIKRLHQEESWLQDSLKQVREFLKELETSSSKTKPVGIAKLEDIRDLVNQNSTTNSSLSSTPTRVPSIEFESAAFNDSANKETA
ncbi:hypothetical protein, partial [Providencia sp. PROV041]|uniref:hypothetical protein n=1 Tax=Providencia sp. PROV041 TaxID=2949772 RepID=UPI00234A2CBD